MIEAEDHAARGRITKKLEMPWKHHYTPRTSLIYLTACSACLNHPIHTYFQNFQGWYIPTVGISELYRVLSVCTLSCSRGRACFTAASDIIVGDQCEWWYTITLAYKCLHCNCGIVVSNEIEMDVSYYHTRCTPPSPLSACDNAPAIRCIQMLRNHRPSTSPSSKPSDLFPPPL